MQEFEGNLAVGAQAVERPLDFADSNPNILYLQKVAENAYYGDDLYGLRLALEFGVNSLELQAYLGAQELTHVQEGIGLLQEDSTHFPFNGDNVLSPLNRRPMAEIGQEGHISQQNSVEEGRGFDFLVTRASHDVEIAKDNDSRMKYSPVGSTWARFSPYAEELSDADAAKAGYWPKARRAYMWLYRKIDDQTMETTIVTIDQSDVAGFAGLMNEHGVDLPTNITSHDVPGFVVELPDCSTQLERSALIKRIRQSYKRYAEVLDIPGLDIGSKEFIEKYARHDIESLVRLQQEIIHSLEANKLSSFAKLATEAVLEQKFLSTEEREEVVKMFNSQRPLQHVSALRLVMRAHRYGVWATVGDKIKSFEGSGITKEQASYYTVSQNEQARLYEYVVGQELKETDYKQMSINVDSAQIAAERGEVKPGCPGGSSFLSQTESEAKEGIFGGKENDPKRWMSCPFCKKKDAVKARVCDTDLKCRHCEAEVKKGKVVNAGNGGKTPEPEKAQTNLKKLALPEVATKAEVIDLDAEREVEINHHSAMNNLNQSHALAA